MSLPHLNKCIFLILLSAPLFKMQNHTLYGINFEDEEMCEMDIAFIESILFKNSPKCVVICTMNQDDDTFAEDLLMRRIYSVIHRNFSQIIKSWKTPIMKSKKLKKFYSISGYENEVGILIARNLSVAETYLKKYQHFIYKNPHAVLVNILFDECGEMSEISPKAENMLREVWNRTGINYFLMVIMCADEKKICLTSHIRTVFKFDPFYYNFNKRGRILEIHYTNISDDYTLFTDLKGIPLKVSRFKSTMLREKPKRKSSDPTEFWGMDVEYTTVIAKEMNFIPVYVKPHGDPYGYRLTNGSYTGTIKDLLEGKSDMSLVGSFIKDYETPDLEFTNSISGDKICLIVPKSNHIPGWMLLSRSFTLQVWFYIVLFSLSTSVLYIVFVVAVRKINKMLNFYVAVRDDALFIQGWRIMSILFSEPVPNLPRTMTERIFVTFCMLWSLIIISGAFQGSLSHTYTTPAYYPDIDTLEKLDQSGFEIAVRSAGLINDIFGVDTINGSIADNLKRKIHRHMMSDEEKKHAMLTRRNVAFDERFFNYKIMSLEYIDSNGISRIHLVSECPKYYNIAYVLPKRSPWLARINIILQRLLQAGIRAKWLQETLEKLQEQAIASSRNIVYEKNKKLSLTHLQLAFILWCIGLCIATVVFLFELYHSKSD